MLIIEKFDAKKINETHKDVIVVERKIDVIEQENREISKNVKILNSGKKKKKH
jgi:prophage maintenance system killer protein